MVPALQGLMGVVKPVLEAFTALPKEMQQVIVLATAGAFGFRSFSNTLKGFNVRIGTANVLTGTLAVTMSSLAIALNEIAKRQDNVTQSMSAMEQAVKESNGLFDDRARRIIENELLTGELGDAIQLLGIDLDDMTQAALGDADAIDRVKEATKAALPQGIDFGYVLRGTIGLLNDEEEAARLVRDTLKGYTEQLEQTGRDQQRLSDNVDETDAEMRRFMDIIESDNIYNFTQDVTEAATGMSELRKETFRTETEMDRLFGRLDDDQAVADFIQAMEDANETMRGAKEETAEYEQGQRDLLFALEDLMETHSLVDAEFAKELLPLVEQGDIDATIEKFQELLSLIGQIPADIQLAIDAGSLGLSIAELKNLPSTVYGLGRQPGAQDGFTANVYISAGVITDPVELGKTTVEAINEYYAIGGAPIGAGTAL
jgi:tetratricopeptide (TPR) repeat protein